MSASLLVGGVTPFSTIDYPGYLSYVVYCVGCSWRCRYCHNPSFLSKDSIHESSFLSWSKVLSNISRRKGFIDSVVFSGGEPTLQSSLLTSVLEVKDLGFKVGLHTSGSSPLKLSPILPLVDWVGFDIKSIEEEYPLVTGVKDSGKASWLSLSNLVSSGVPYEVRMTLHSSLHSIDTISSVIFRLESLGVKTLYLQKVRSNVMFDSSLGLSTVDWASLIRKLQVSTLSLTLFLRE